MRKLLCKIKGKQIWIKSYSTSRMEKSWKLISVLGLIRASWMENFSKINKRPGTFIRHSRVFALVKILRFMFQQALLGLKMGWIFWFITLDIWRQIKLWTMLPLKIWCNLFKSTVMLHYFWQGNFYLYWKLLSRMINQNLRFVCFELFS